MADIKCLKCSRQFVRRVSRSGLAEALLSVVYVYPFKCQICGFRFRMLRWGVRDLSVEEDHREYDRMPMSFPMSYSGGGIAGEGLALNISIGGCSFSTLSQVAIGMIFQLGLQISDEVPPVQVDAAMVRYVRGQSVGVEFLQWRQSERKRLQLFVRGLLIGR